jgi:hypothetical protein
LVEVLKNQGRQPYADAAAIAGLLSKELIRLHRDTWWTLTPRGFDIAQREILLRAGLDQPHHEAILE